jgi:hypothetical protein
MNQPAFDEFADWEGAPARSHSSSFDQRRRPETLRTVIAMAFFWPTRTTSSLPRVEEITSICADFLVEQGIVKPIGTRRYLTRKIRKP